VTAHGPIDPLLAELHASRGGLTSDEARRRLDGLESGPAEHWWHEVVLDVRKFTAASPSGSKAATRRASKAKASKAKTRKTRRR
jgi:hypothetical protein